MLFNKPTPYRDTIAKIQSLCLQHPGLRVGEARDIARARLEKQQRELALARHAREMLERQEMRLVAAIRSLKEARDRNQVWIHNEKFGSRL